MLACGAHTIQHTLQSAEHNTGYNAKYTTEYNVGLNAERQLKARVGAPQCGGCRRGAPGQCVGES